MSSLCSTVLSAVIIDFRLIYFDQRYHTCFLGHIFLLFYNYNIIICLFFSKVFFDSL